jgi:hypothetical protein
MVDAFERRVRPRATALRSMVKIRAELRETTQLRVEP